MKNISLKIPEGMVSKLDKLKHKTTLSRCALIRLAIRDFLKRRSKDDY